MRRLLLAIATILASFYASSQPTTQILGEWNGVLKIQGMQLRIVFHIDETDNGLSSTMDSPDQRAFGIATTSTELTGSSLKISITNINAEFSGVLANGEIEGTFNQAGMDIPLKLTRQKFTAVKPYRPQTPRKPYPYISEDVTFSNPNANITLAGTLTLPSKEGKFPVVVFISGSGPQNRDEELFDHKPFLVIADYLARNGIAALRFDDRGTAESGGTFRGATTADFATDVESAIAYLKTRKEVDPNKIGLIGHSEGGIIAPLVASRTNDLKFIVLLAGTGIRGDKLMLLQQELILRASGASENCIKKTCETNNELFKMVMKSNNNTKLAANITNKINGIIESDTSFTIPNGMSNDDYISATVKQITDPWIQYFLKYDPANALRKTKCAVLAINGDKDLQVPAEVNLNAIKLALEKGGNTNVITKQFPDLNHLFQKCKTGHPSEYAQIEQTISIEVLEYITKWIGNNY